jgi:Ca2+-binding EF-hand superfamily protein
MKFLNENTKCLDGFNLTNDEYLRVFSALDNHKKKYLTLMDLKNKLADFILPDKMHSEIKDFITNSFTNVDELIKYIKNLELSKEINKSKTNTNGFRTINDSLTKKEFFNGIENFFPRKYTTNQILSYISNHVSENISINELNRAYFENVVLFKKKSLSKTSNGFAFHKRSRSELRTIYDSNPLEKLKRLLKYSNYEPSEFFKLYEIVNDGKINPVEFRNMIKRMNLGYTPIEIDKLLAYIDRDKDGLIDLKNFIHFTNRQYFLLKIQGKFPKS